MIYCDTSLLVSALTVEVHSTGAKSWLADQIAGDLCISNWVITEFSSAISLKMRRKEVTTQEHTKVLAHWRTFQMDHLSLLPVPHHAFDLAARFADQYQLGLRASDALHLAVASLGGHSLATLDKVMAEAAGAVGVMVVGVE